MPELEIDALEKQKAALGGDGTLDTPPEVQFDRVVTLACLLFDAPIAALVLVDRHGKWFKASSGKDLEQSGHEISFCRRAMQHDAAIVVLDTLLDPRLADMQPALSDSKIRFLAGANLRDAQNQNLGAMGIISPEPRSEFTNADQRKLESLAEIVCLGIELNRHVRRARTAASEQIRALREANSRIKNSLNYANLLAEVESAKISTDKLAVVGMAAWRQYTEAGGVLSSSMRSLRERMTAEEYKELVTMMPGFMM
jgi:GAF domain-containing protein